MPPASPSHNNNQIMRHFSHPARRIMPGLLVSVLLLQACNDSIDPILPAAFSLSVGASSLSLTQGGSASTSIMVVRSGASFSSPIAYVVTGAPTGLATNVVATSVADSETFAVTATASMVPGVYQIMVTANAAGVPAQQVTILVTVSAATGGVQMIRSVVAGSHTCALTTASKAYCWGYNADGQLGNNETSLVNPTPSAVAGGFQFATLFLSKVEGVTCGVTAPGAAYCWGDNDDGELGDGTRTQRTTPTPVAGGLAFRSFAVGTVHTCGVALNGTAYCWGFTTAGAFGDGSTGLRTTPAVAAPGLTFDNIVAGQDFTCGLTPLGAAYCWGRGTDGQLGNGAAANSATPVPVSGGIEFAYLVAGGLSVCGVTTGAKAYCWGSDFFGTLGDGSSATDDGVTRRVAPVEVAGGLFFKSLSAGYSTVCGVASSGAAYCWGSNGGSIGDGTMDQRSRPTLVAGGLTFQSIAVGTGQTCGVTTDSALYCWGSNSNGELGDGTTSPHSVPTPVRWP